MFKAILERQKKALEDAVIVFFFLLAALIVVQIFLGASVLRYARKARAEYKTKEARLKDCEALIKSVPNPQKTIEEIQAKVEEFKKKGISTKESLRIIQVLGESSKAYNIDVISIKIRDDLKKLDESLPPGVANVYIEMILKCSYQVLGQYLQSLNELPQGFFLESLGIEKKEVVLSAEAGNKVPQEAGKKQEELLAKLLLTTYSVWGL